MSTSESNHKTMCKNLLYEIREGRFSDADRLPRETVLAEEYGISRNQLRDVLSQLETEGYITRRHGVGTLINRHVVDLKTRFDIEKEYMEIIRSNGYTPGVGAITVTEKTASALVAKHLGMEENEPVLAIGKVLTADGHPAIYSEDIVNLKLIRYPYTDDIFQKPIFEFLDQICFKEYYMDICKFHAVLVDEFISEKLNLPEGAPILKVEEVDYDIEGNPLFYSNQYFADAYFEQTVLRKKL